MARKGRDDAKEARRPFVTRPGSSLTGKLLRERLMEPGTTRPPQLSVDSPISGGSLDQGNEIQSAVRFHT